MQIEGDHQCQDKVEYIFQGKSLIVRVSIWLRVKIRGDVTVKVRVKVRVR